jgi:plastocyanin
LASTRLHRLAILVAVWAAAGLAAAQTAAAATPVHVKVRVEGPAHTVTQSRQVPITGTFVGHKLSGPTALGALLAAGRHRHFPVGLEWFDCCGFFVNSVAGVPGDATHFWAFKVGHTLSQIGAGAVKATPGMSALFYYTTFDPNTGATEPTLGLDPANRTIARGATVTFTVSSWDDAGHGSAAGGAWVNVNGIATRADPAGHLTVQFTHTGTFPVKATLAGAIRSRTIWVHVTRSGSS